MLSEVHLLIEATENQKCKHSQTCLQFVVQVYPIRSVCQYLTVTFHSRLEQIIGN
jgi:hypothetical protein